METRVIKGLLVLALVLAVGSAEAKKAPPPTPLGPAIVVDANGTQIGPIVWSKATINGATEASSTQTLVLLKVNGFWASVFVSTGGFLSSTTALLYTTSDCSGTAYFQVVPGSLISNATVSGSTLFFGDPSVAQSLQFNSFAIVFQGSIQCEPPFSFNGTIPASPVQTFDLSTLGFTPPFSISVSGM